MPFLRPFRGESSSMSHHDRSLCVLRGRYRATEEGTCENEKRADALRLGSAWPRRTAYSLSSDIRRRASSSRPRRSQPSAFGAYLRATETQTRSGDCAN